jgi:hypothetical protein
MRALGSCRLEAETTGFAPDPPALAGTGPTSPRHLGLLVPSNAGRFVAFELLLNPADGSDWQFKRDLTITRPLTEIGLSRDGAPFLAPEIVLLHKATSGQITEQDSADLAAVLGYLSEPQRAWLAGAISRYAPAHPWLDSLLGRRSSTPSDGDLHRVRASVSRTGCFLIRSSNPRRLK